MYKMKKGIVSRTFCLFLAGLMLLNHGKIYAQEPNDTEISESEREDSRVAQNLLEKKHTKENVTDEISAEKNSLESPITIGSQYVQCVINEDGRFNIGTLDHDCLLYDYPDGTTSDTLIHIDNEDYFFDYYVEDVVADSEKQCTAVAMIDDVEIKQILKIEKNPSTTEEDLVSISYQCINKGDSLKKVGIRIMLDTMLGQNDGAPFKVNGCGLTTEREYSGSNIPTIYQAMDSLTNPNNVATGYLFLNAGDKPDKVQFAYWPQIRRSEWNYQVDASCSLIYDSAIAIYFDDAVLEPNVDRYVSTRYGVYNSEPANVYDSFSYSNSVYNHKLAMHAAKYAALAYESYIYDPNIDIFYDVKDAEYYKLKDRLKGDGFSDIKKYGYKKPTENGASFYFANKKVNHNGKARDLIVVVIRGTKDIQWKGNMNLVKGKESGPFDDNESYSFQQGANEVKAELKKYCSDKELKDAMILITGHSRGAAIGNLLAAEITKNGLNCIDKEAVYAYLFAVPNCTKSADKSMTNIYNFCLEDDFVPSVPLNDPWRYDKHGTTFKTSAAKSYRKNSNFKGMLDAITITTHLRSPSFKLAECKDLIKYIGKKWKTVKSYYTLEINKYDNNTLYKFMHNVVAPGAMSETKASIKLFFIQAHGEFKKIADYFVDGTHAAHNVNDNHQMYTYYAALRNNCFDTPDSITEDRMFSAENENDIIEYAATNEELIAENELDVQMQDANDITNKDEMLALKAFAEQDNNANLLMWDFDDLDSMQGVVFDEKHHVTEIDLAYWGDDDDGNEQYLTGMLDLSSFYYLSHLSVAGNKINKIILPLETTSVLSYLDCSHNLLEDLDITGQPLQFLNISYNYIDITKLESKIKQIEEQNEAEVNYERQNIPEDAIFDSCDMNKLKGIQFNEDIWDMNTPELLQGVSWEKIDGVYRVTRLELSGLGMKNTLDLSSMENLEYIDCSGNLIRKLDVSNSPKLKVIQCSNNQLTELDMENTEVEFLFCDGNYLAEENIVGSAGLIDFARDWQGVKAPLSDFANSEYELLSSMAEVLEEDVLSPGEWREVRWKKKNDGLYHVEELDLSGYTLLTGEIDLNGFSYLSDFDMAGTGFSKIVLPNHLEEVPNCAFIGCNNLEEVIFPTQIRKIGEGAFRDCKSLQMAVFPNQLSQIEGNAFRGCVGLERVYFTGDAPACGSDVFSGVGPSFTIFSMEKTDGFDQEPYTLYISQKIGSLSVYHLPDKLNYYYGEQLDTKGLCLLELSSNGRYKIITDGYQISESDILPKGNHTIHVAYKEDMTSFDVIVFDAKIEAEFEYFCRNLKVGDQSVFELDIIYSSLGDDLLKKSISWSSGNEGILTVDPIIGNPLKAKVKAVSKGGCYVNVEVYNRTIRTYVRVSAPDNENSGNIIGTENKQTQTALNTGTVIKTDGGKTKYIVTNDGTTPKVSYAGTSAKKKIVSIPATIRDSKGVEYKVTAISSNAFKNNKTIEQVKVGNNIEVVEKNAFSDCKKIKEVTFAKRVRKINARAFKNCISLTKITIPSTVTSIGKDAFKGCKKLKTINIKSKKLKTIGKNAFKGIHKKSKISVPKTKRIVYQKMLRKSGYKGKIK